MRELGSGDESLEVFEEEPTKLIFLV